MKLRIQSRHRDLARRLPMALALIVLISAMGVRSLSGKATGSGATVTARTFISLLARADFATAEHYFAPTVQAALPEEKLRQTWERLITQLGTFRRQAGVTEQTAGSLKNVVVSCVFAQATADLVISVDQSNKIAGFHIVNVQRATTYTPPSYVRTTSFHEQAVTIGHAPWALAGTLALPKGHGPFPAVVLVSGSGPNDRNETINGDQPFRDIAWGLASQRVAVLRYDKRTLVYGTTLARVTNFTVKDEFLDDAIAAVYLLRHTKGIDHHRIYVLGHSEGGMVAPRIAQQDPQIAGLILMAAPTRPLVDVIVSQYTYLHSRGFVTAAQLANARQQAAEIRALTPADRGHGGNLFGAPAAYWLDLKSYHPTTVAQRLTIPMLILQGARDYQVTLADFQGWMTALVHHARVTFKSYPGLFHPFIPVPSGSSPGLATPKAYNHPGHVAPNVIHDLTVWLARISKR